MAPRLVFAVAFLLSVTQCLCADNPSPQDRKNDELAEEYYNFTLAVGDAVSKFEGDSNQRADIIATIAGSAYGFGQILVTANQKLWPVAIPGFETTLKQGKNLPEAYAELLSTLDTDKDLKITNLIFTPDTVSLTPELAKMKTEIQKVDFKTSNVGTQINDNISKNIDASILDSYIPSKATLPTSTKAVLINTVYLTATWPSALNKVGTENFNGVEQVDMYEIKGGFPYLEFDKMVQVTIPFKNNARALVLILPSDISDVMRGDFGEPINGTAPVVRVQFPLFNFTFRLGHSVAKSNSECDFSKAENFVHFLDDIVHVSVGKDKFEAASVTGALINNVAQYKQEISASPPASPSPSNFPSTGSAPTNKLPSLARSDKDSTPDEKLILIDRSFQWRIDDINMGPIFYGTVESLKNPSTTSADNNPSIFGLDSNLPYMNCL